MLLKGAYCVGEHFVDPQSNSESMTTHMRYRVPRACTNIYEPPHKISNNVVCATSKASDQPAHMRSLISGFASRLNIL